MSTTVIIPAYNVESCLPRCLDSVFAQTVRPTEVIVVNDGSTDGTAAAAHCYGDRIVYVEQSNQGQGAARNAGLRVSRGEYVAFLDADDYWRPDFLRETTAFLAKHEEVVAVNTGYLLNKRGKQRIGPPGLSVMPDAKGDGRILDSFFDTWAKYDHVRTGTVLMRRRVIEQAGPQLEIRMSQDLEYWGYLATFGPWGFIPRPLWVGDSHAQGLRAGWLKKYRRRRKACPSVEEWEHRIVPRLRPADLPAFRMVQGRVAANFMYAMIMAGNDAGALDVLKAHGVEMPVNMFTTWSQKARVCRALFWRAFCRTVRVREYCKAIR